MRLVRQLATAAESAVVGFPRIGHRIRREFRSRAIPSTTVIRRASAFERTRPPTHSRHAALDARVHPDAHRCELRSIR
jgi:hypothetical protein